jgi:hypothetical protein
MGVGHVIARSRRTDGTFFDSASARRMVIGPSHLKSSFCGDQVVAGVLARHVERHVEDRVPASSLFPARPNR